MSKKRRQRSTTIRKRIEKKQREEEKARKKQAKAAGGQGTDIELRVVVGRGAAEACAAAILDLSQRLAAGPIRGWTPSDLGGEHGLVWLAERIQESLAAQGGDPLEVDILEGTKTELLDKQGGLEMAAPGLGLNWEQGFDDLFQALARAEELPEPEPEEDDDESVDESADEDDG